MAVKIGKASYGGKKSFAVKKDVPLIARIIPPLFDLADKGKWATYTAVEWGYKGSDGRMKPFLDVHVKNRKTQMVEVQSPAYLRREALIKRKDELVAGLKAGTSTQDDVKKAVDLVKQFNLDKKFYVNFKTLNGELGVLKINYKMKQALDAEIKKLRDKGIDPISVENGRLFTFSSTNATGALQDWMFTVVEYKEQINHPELGQIEKPVIDVLDESIINRLEAECSELDKLYKSVTVADVQAFIEEGATAVDRVLGQPAPEAKPAQEAAPVANNTAAETAVAQRAEAVAETAQAPLQSEPVAETAPIQGTIVQEPVQETAPAAQAEPVPEVQSEPITQEAVAQAAAAPQSDEEYLKSIGAL